MVSLIARHLLWHHDFRAKAAFIITKDNINELIRSGGSPGRSGF